MFSFFLAGKKRTNNEAFANDPNKCVRTDLDSGLLLCYHSGALTLVIQITKHP
jgi:hypothetical protein